MSNNTQNKSSNAEAIGCRKYLTPSSLVSGNPHLKLTFVANLFNTWPGLNPLDEQGAKDYGAIDDFDAEGAREIFGFTLFGRYTPSQLPTPLPGFPSLLLQASSLHSWLLPPSQPG
ncbi:hypothetical protein DFH29DRAFT_1001321 [Suillus ampliporus]|nr:hypothetical protein DFH29DRAFT_1001321 [Suillus ampliporus]